MRLYTHCYDSIGELTTFVSDNQLETQAGLIQIFSGVADVDALSSVLSIVHQLLPNYAVIGASTSGEIDKNGVTENQILIAIATFDHTRCEVRVVNDCSEPGGREIGLELAKTDAKLVIAFGNALTENPEPFLHGLAEGAPDLCCTGGSAGDNSLFKSTYVIAGEQVLHSGLALAVLYGDRLRVSSHFSLNWTPIGNEMEVTACEGNKLYQLDGVPAIERYQYYLGKDITADMPKTINGFPLLSYYDGVVQARDAIGSSKEGALVFAGNFKLGQKVRFGLANVENILTQSRALGSYIKSMVRTEAAFIYSCAGRKTFLAEAINDEINALVANVPSAGFFTYGEYYHTQGENRLLNITTTMVTLSEQIGAGVYGDVSLLAKRESQPSVINSLTHLANVTARDLRASLRLSEQYKIALDETAIVIKTDSEGKITYVNSLFEKLTGYSKAEVLGKAHIDICNQHTQASVLKKARENYDETGVFNATIQIDSRKPPGYLVLNYTGLAIDDDPEHLGQYIGVGQDITELIRQEQQIAQQRTDKLTGMPNRVSLLEDLENNPIDTLALGDVKSFKAINDYYGITFGDYVIAELANYLNRVLAEKQTRCYRLYGAEFAFIPPAGLGREAFKSLLLNALSGLDNNPIKIGDEPLDIEMYFGVAHGSNHLLAMAEAALQHSKQDQNGSRATIFSANSHNHLEKQLWIKTVKEALQDGRLVCHYQPIANAANGEIKHFETLVRLQDKNGELISPALFLPIIKPTRYYLQLTYEVLDQAIAAAKIHGCCMSVNLSAEDLAQGHTRRFIKQRLAEFGGKNLIFEITEGESLRDFKEVREFIQMIRHYEAKIAIDDFGSGYSNFSYLVELQPDYVKIDGSIISGILTDRKSLLVTQSIIELCHRIGAKIVAEFVASDEIAALLRSLGADYLQGFAIGKPLPISQIQST